MVLAKGHRIEETKMSEAVEDFMDAWLDANVTRKHAKQPEPEIIRQLAARCVADAHARGITLDSLEDVVCDIEEAIADELNFIATLQSKGP